MARCEISECVRPLKGKGTTIEFNLGGLERFTIKICEFHARQVECNQLRAYSIGGSSGNYTADIRPVLATETEHPRLNRAGRRQKEK